MYVQQNNHKLNVDYVQCSNYSLDSCLLIHPYNIDYFIA